MAAVKISNLPAATLPMSGNEAVPVVQNNTTVKVDVANLAVNAANVIFVPTGSVTSTTVQGAIAELADPTAVSAAGTGAQTVFAVVVKPTAIYINGIYQNKNTWSYAGGNVTFSQAPPVTSAIEFLI
jgi:hypothetical protein